MAQTGAVIQFLLAGAKNPNTGADIASGKARFYQPGTLTPQNVYSDDACTAAISQPYTLGAGGEAKLFMLDPVRIIIKDSTDTSTLIDTVCIQRWDQVYIQNANINGGVEETLETFLIDGLTNGTFQYLESAGATARTYQSWLKETHVSVVDFAADNTGSNDCTTNIQAAIDEVKTLGGGIVYFPKGIYRISSTLNVGTTASYIGVSLQGAGRGASIIRNHSTTNPAITVNVGSAADCKLFISDLSVTAITTSSGAGIIVTNGDRIVIERVGVGLHRSGIITSAVTGAKLVDCLISSTDDNAAAVGINLGTLGRAVDCEVISGTANGTGLTVGQDARASGGYVNKFATGIALSGTRARIHDITVDTATTGITISGTGGARATECYVTGGTTGISLTGTDSKAQGCVVASATTGISFGAARTHAFACVVSSATTGLSLGANADQAAVFCRLTGNTTDISINSGATTPIEFGNSYTTLTDTAGRGHAWLAQRRKVEQTATKTTSSSTTPSWTPTPESSGDVIPFESTSAGAATATVNATATTGLVNGYTMTLVFYRNAAANNLGLTMNAQYVVTDTNFLTVAANTYVASKFMWFAATSTWNQVTSHAHGTTVTAGAWG